MSYKRATVNINYYQNKHKFLSVSAKVSQRIADLLAVRYLELLDWEKRNKVDANRSTE